jgi:hypothetical protein
VLGRNDVDCRSVIVGVLDTGIDFSHDDLAANAWTGPFANNGVNFESGTRGSGCCCAGRAGW